MITFEYDSEITSRYPDVVGGIIYGQAVQNTPTPAPLQEQYRTEQAAAIERIGATPLSEIPALAAWRKVFRGFNVDPTQYRSAAEALLRRLTKQGDIPSINTLVDLGNLISIRYALPVAVVDIAHVTGGRIRVHFADGRERYTVLGQSEPEHPVSGEVIFSDEAKLVFARRWCWRQSAESAATLDTRSPLITIEAHHAGGREDVTRAVRDLFQLLHTYVPGEFHATILDSNTREATFA
jgi:DNA/RNA-binding domain of Phe-tRNA-synthetase-like protein